MESLLSIDQKTWNRVTVVIVTYNSAAVIGTSLNSVASAKEIIVVDNASTDSTCETVTKTMPRVKIIRNSINRGFGAAVNQGLAIAKTEFGFCFSPDAILTDGAMECLCSAADQNPGSAMFGPFLKRPDGNQEMYVMGPYEFRHSKMLSRPEGQFCTWFVMGGVFLYRMAAWKNVGGFDERIFLYGEDVDLSIRTTQAGFSLMVVPEASVIHIGGGSSRPGWSVKWQKDWHQTWSRLYVMAKHEDPGRAKREAINTLVMHLWKTLIYLVILRPDRVRGNFAKVSGAWTFITCSPSKIL